MNIIDEEGKSHWRFDSFEEQRFVHPTDSNVFWVSLFVTPAIWVLLAFGTVLSLKFAWCLLVLVALGLSLINAVGYVKCKRDAGKKMTALGGSVLTRGLTAWSSMRSGAASNLAPV